MAEAAGQSVCMRRSNITQLRCCCGESPGHTLSCSRWQNLMMCGARVCRAVSAAPGFFEELLPLITEELMGDEDTRHFVPQVYSSGFVFVPTACRAQYTY